MLHFFVSTIADKVKAGSNDGLQCREVLFPFQLKNIILVDRLQSMWLHKNWYRNIQIKGCNFAFIFASCAAPSGEFWNYKSHFGYASVKWKSPLLLTFHLKTLVMFCDKGRSNYSKAFPLTAHEKNLHYFPLHHKSILSPKKYYWHNSDLIYIYYYYVIIISYIKALIWHCLHISPANIFNVCVSKISLHI